VAKGQLSFLIATNRASAEKRALFEYKILHDKEFYDQVLRERERFKSEPDENRRLRHAITRAFGGSVEPRYRRDVAPAVAMQARSDQSNPPRPHVPRDVASRLDQGGRVGTATGNRGAQSPAPPTRTPYQAHDELDIETIADGGGSEEQKDSFRARLLHDSNFYQAIYRLQRTYELESKYSTSAENKAARFRGELLRCDVMRMNTRAPAPMQGAVTSMAERDPARAATVAARPSPGPALVGRNPPGKGAPP
jgi:hypothetical protein